MTDIDEQPSSEPVEQEVAVFHRSLSVRHLPAVGEALQNAIGEKLYLKGPGIRLVSLGEPHEPRHTTWLPDAEDVLELRQQLLLQGLSPAQVDEVWPLCLAWFREKYEA